MVLASDMDELDDSLVEYLHNTQSPSTTESDHPEQELRAYLIHLRAQKAALRNQIARLDMLPALRLDPFFHALPGGDAELLGMCQRWQELKTQTQQLREEILILDPYGRYQLPI